MTNTSLITAAAALLIATGVAATARAGGSTDEAAALQGAKVSLSQAIATAEQQTGGRAYDAGVDAESGRPAFHVETTGPKGVQTVAIDAQTGQVTSTHAGAEAD